jgi:MFS transporter, DHA1 family, inner membrane transport protein
MTLHWIRYPLASKISPIGASRNHREPYVEAVPTHKSSGELPLRQWVAVLATVCTAFSSQMTMPLWIAAAIHHLGVTDEVAGRVGAAEYTAVAVVSAAVGMSLQRANIRKVMTFGMAILILGNLLSAFAPGALLLALGRIACGLGKGMVVGVSFGLLAGTANPTRAFAIINGGYACFAAAFYFFTPTVVAWGGSTGVFLMLAAAATAGAGLLVWYPRERLQASRSAILPLRELPAFGWVAALMLTLLAVGHSAVWTFIARLGEHHDLTRTQIGSTLSIAALLTVAGPALASILDVRHGFAIPLTSGVFLKAVIAAGLAYTASATGYFVLTPIFLLLNLFIIPYVMGMMALADPVGRLAGSASAAQQGGNAAGALIGGMLVTRVGYHGLALLVAVLFVFVIVLVVGFSPAASRRARLAVSS